MNDEVTFTLLVNVQGHYFIWQLSLFISCLLD